MIWVFYTQQKEPKRVKRSDCVFCDLSQCPAQLQPRVHHPDPLPAALAAPHSISSQGPVGFGGARLLRTSKPPRLRVAPHFAHWQAAATEQWLSPPSPLSDAGGREQARTCWRGWESVCLWDGLNRDPLNGELACRRGS